MTERCETVGGAVIAGRYRLVELIGRGGMGAVWRAWDHMLDRHVAVKRLHTAPHLSEAERLTLYERTRREARSAGRISHPNVVVVHDVLDDEQGLPCIVMEYVPARTLADVLRDEGPLPPEEAARIGQGMVAALRAAHAAGVLHRDVKPGNVLLGTDGRVVLTDFGIAVASDTSTLTRPGELVGSVDFLAPERLHGQSTPGPASDLWSLGATLFQAVEGFPPFRRDTAIETAYAIATEPAPTPRRAGPLAPLVRDLLVKEPERRPTAEEVERRLREPAATTPTEVVDHADLAPTAVVARADLTPPGPDGESAVTRRLPQAAGAVERPGNRAGRAPHRTVGDVDGTRPGDAGPERRRRTRRGRALALVVAVVVLVPVLAGAGLWTLRTLREDDAAGGRAPGATGSHSPRPRPSPVPAGYRLVRVPELDVSFPVPQDWRETHRSATGVRYVDPTGQVGLRIDVLDFASSDQVAHCRELEEGLRAQGNGYRRLRLHPTAFRRYPAAVWEFAFQGSTQEFRAIDLVFGREGGREYAVYLSGPSADWERHRRVFTRVQQGLRLPAE